MPAWAWALLLWLAWSVPAGIAMGKLIKVGRGPGA